MNTYTVFAAVALAVSVVAEAPSGYNYHRPTTGGTHLVGGGTYHEVSFGHQTSEGASLDHALLEKVRQILFREEQNSHSTGIGATYIPSSRYGAPSPQYGVPSPQYGVPGYATRIVGINLEGIKQAIQVAQYHQISHQEFGGYPSGPSHRYGVPSGSYGVAY